MCDEHDYTATCECCGERFLLSLKKDGTPRKTKWKFCSDKCKWKYRNERRPSKAKPKEEKTCLCCGDGFIPSTANNYLFCSVGCKKLYHNFKHNGSARAVRLPEYSRIDTPECKCCGRLFISFGDRKYCNLCRKRPSQHLSAIVNGVCEIQCRYCGIAFSRILGTAIQFCSDHCRTTREKEVNAAHKSKRRAVEKAIDADHINPYKIFWRDGWKCKHCGKKTPRKNRGTTKSNAPELDHIIPLSIGGTHTEDNVQTLCRCCNQKKSNGALFDQLLLMG